MDESAPPAAIVVHLVGPPGVGKSHLGVELAKAMHLQVVDAADHPSRQLGRTDWPAIDQVIRIAIGAGLSVVLVSTGLSQGVWRTIERLPVPVHTVALIPSSIGFCRGRLVGKARRRVGPSLSKILDRWALMLEDPGAWVHPGLKFAIRYPITFEETDLEGLRALITRLGG